MGMAADFSHVLSGPEQKQSTAEGGNAAMRIIDTVFFMGPVGGNGAAHRFALS
jgi:hypothetical protein